MQQIAVLLDHLVRAREQRLRHGEPERPRGLIVDDQLELIRLHDRHVRWLTTFEDTGCVGAYLTIRVSNVASIAHQPAGLRMLTPAIYCRDRVTHRCQR